MEAVRLTRDCDAVQIPAGNTVRLPAGAEGWLTQALGDSYTIQLPAHGGLYRIAGRDADAIGKEPTAAAATPAAARPLSEDSVRDELRHVYDPEIPVNILDLGLVYDLRLEPQPSGKSRVLVRMTLTAHGCGMGPSIAMDAQRRIEALPGVESADVQIVWEPPWNPHMISPAGKKKLGIE